MNSPIPLSQWEIQGNVWPTKSAWYHMLRPDKLRNELLDAGVAKQINGRWLIFPEAWQQCPSSNKWNRGSDFLVESFVPHFQFTRRVVGSANGVSRWSFS